VFLDAGGVLVHPNWSRISETLARHGVVAGAAALAAADPHAKKRLDSGPTIQATSDQQRGWRYFDLVLTEAAIGLSDATAQALAELHVYHQTSNLWETVHDDVRPMLAALRSHGYRLVVVSNANGTLARAFDRLGLTPALDAVFDSYDEGVEKPDPRFFHMALTRTGSEAHSTVHVGDLYHVDVVGARAAGIEPILLDAAGLYEECDCTRVASLPELVDLLVSRPEAVAKKPR